MTSKRFLNKGGKDKKERRIGIVAKA